MIVHEEKYQHYILSRYIPYKTVSKFGNLSMYFASASHCDVEAKTFLYPLAQLHVTDASLDNQ